MIGSKTWGGRLLAVTAGGALMVAGSASASPVLLLDESFETDGQGTRYTSTVDNRGNSNLYFLRTDNNTTSSYPHRTYEINADPSVYTGFDGDWLWAGENVDSFSSVGTRNPASVTLNPLNIAGYTDLEVSGLFGGTDAGDTGYMEVSYSIDGGDFVSGLRFAPMTDVDGVALNGEAGDDNENVLGGALKSFSFAVPEGGTLQIKVAIRADAASDEFAFDQIQVRGVPEPGSLGLLLVGGGLMLGRRRGSKTGC